MSLFLWINVLLEDRINLLILVARKKHLNRIRLCFILEHLSLVVLLYQSLVLMVKSYFSFNLNMKYNWASAWRKSKTVGLERNQKVSNKVSAIPKAKPTWFDLEERKKKGYEMWNVCTYKLKKNIISFKY